MGTVRFNRKNMPEELRNLEKGDAVAMSQDDGCKVAGQKHLIPFGEQCMTTIPWWTQKNKGTSEETNACP